MMNPRKRKLVKLYDRDLIASRQSWRCNICKELLPPGFQLDHVKALVNGGKDDLSNMQALCATCHVCKTKNDIDPDGYERRTLKSKYFKGGPKDLT